MTDLTRRRMLTITAAAAVVASNARAATRPARWTGTAMGAPASLTLAGVDPETAGRLAARVEAEIARIEDVFSLFRPDSALSRLNRDGGLDLPPQELLEVLALTRSIHDATGGAFDPTVQPLWLLHAARAQRQQTPTPAEIADARSRVGFHRVRFGPQSVAFARPGMALTLNGIAQGYAADRIADLLRREGLRDILVDMGEIRAHGQRPDGGPWRVGIAAPNEAAPVGAIGLSDRALATSAPHGTMIDAANGTGHILDPRTGRAGGVWSLVSVSARSAAVADGLSTGICLLEEDHLRSALRQFPGARVEVLRA